MIQQKEEGPLSKILMFGHDVDEQGNLWVWVSEYKASHSEDEELTIDLNSPRVILGPMRLDNISKLRQENASAKLHVERMTKEIEKLRLVETRAIIESAGCDSCDHKEPGCGAWCTLWSDAAKRLRGE